MSSLSHREKFVSNPEKFLAQPPPESPVPVRLAIVGPAKSGKSSGKINHKRVNTLWTINVTMYMYFGKGSIISRKIKNLQLVEIEISDTVIYTVRGQNFILFYHSCILYISYLQNSCDRSLEAFLYDQAWPTRRVTKQRTFYTNYN